MDQIAENGTVKKRIRYEEERGEARDIVDTRERGEARDIVDTREKVEARPINTASVKRVYEPSYFNKHGLDCSLRIIGDFIGRYLGRPNIEIEAKLGILIDKNTSKRINLPVLSETVLANAPFYRFASDMTTDQHSKFNQLLNKELIKTKASDYKGTVINYEHLYEKDVFYNEKNGNKVRVTINTKTNEIVENGIITKVKLDQLDIFSPQTRMDFRVSINEEKKVSKPTTSPEHEREKDRLSYRHELFRIDLTQVKSQNSHSQDRGQGWEKAKVSHELEVEIIDLKPIFEEYKLHLRGLPNQYYSLLQIFLTNIRLLARSSNKF